MTKGRLTREELGWLLTQEAQGAADRLRSGLQVIRTQAPPAPTTGADDASGEMDRSLDALDDVMRMLSNLNQRAVGGAPRRGRIDLAALVYEVAPSARVSIEPVTGGTSPLVKPDAPNVDALGEGPALKRGAGSTTLLPYC